MSRAAYLILENGTVFEGKEHLAFFLFLATLMLSGITLHLLVAIRRHRKR